MLIRRILIRLRITLTILFVLGLLTVAGGIFYLNSIGLNDNIRSHISSELEERGIYIEFDSLKYELTDGLVAKNVSLYHSPERLTKIASLPEVSINLDKTKLLRGIRKINSLSLKKADIEIPVNPNAPTSARVKINEISGSIDFPQTGAISTSKLTASYLGVNITLAGNLWQEKHTSNSVTPEGYHEARAEGYQNFLTQIKQWQWNEATPPELKLLVEGDINAPDKIKIEFEFLAPELESNGYALKEVKTVGDFSHNLLTIDELVFFNQNKKAKLSVDYDFTIKNGIFSVDSDIHLQDFVKTFFKQELLKGFNITGSSELHAKGQFKLPSSQEDSVIIDTLPAFITPSNELEVKITGSAKLKSYEYLGSKFNTFSSDFSWNNGDIYLDKLVMQNDDGYLKGRLLIKNKIITYDTETTLPKSTFSPFVKKGGNAETFFKQIIFDKESKVFCKSKGTINANDLTDWVSDGEIHFTNISYNGINAESLATKFRWLDSTLSGSVTLKDAKYKSNSFQQLDASFHLKNETLTAKLNLTKPTFKETTVDSFKTTLTYYNKQLRLDGIEAIHPSGKLTGNFFTSDQYYHYDVASSMDPFLFIPFIRNKNTVDFIRNAEISPNSKFYVTAKGQLNRSNIKDWKSEGQATFNEFKFNGVELNSVKTSYKIDPKGLLLETSRLVFDYKNYQLYKLFKGSDKGEATVKKCYIDNKARTVSIEGIEGRAHPAPIARMFHAPVADHLEEYQFYNPPTIKASGVFDTISRDTPDQKLDFTCQLSSASSSRYKFLDGNLLLENLSANIQIIKNKVNIKQLRCNLFDKGIAQANLFFTIPKQGPTTYSGDLNWQNINFRQLGITYNFDEVQKGRLRGNVQFTGNTNDISSFSTKKDTMGTFALENGDLVSIPVLGPVSFIINPFISPLAGGNALNERLKDISATFQVVNGVIITDDIESLTTSLTFLGEGSINLNNDQIDITIRVNYRGLLGKAMELGGEIIKLPVKLLRAVFLNKKPAETGLIQVRGRGHYKDPAWKLVPFDPPRNFDVPLFKPGKAQEVPRAKPVQ